MTTAFPLAWPPGVPRTPATARKQSAFKVTLPAAIKALVDELERFGATHIVLSSNATLGVDRPADPGIAVYFVRRKRQCCIPCDRYADLRGNVRAIGLSIEAFRSMDRWGASQIVEAAFQGFSQLPPPGDRRPWWDVLEVGQGAGRTEIEAAYRRLARACHPDVAGGSHERMAEINRARDEALQVSA